MPDTLFIFASGQTATLNVADVNRDPQPFFEYPSVSFHGKRAYGDGEQLRHVIFIVPMENQKYILYCDKAQGKALVVKHIYLCYKNEWTCKFDTVSRTWNSCPWYWLHDLSDNENDARELLERILTKAANDAQWLGTIQGKLQARHMRSAILREFFGWKESARLSSKPLQHEHVVSAEQLVLQPAVKIAPDAERLNTTESNTLGADIHQNTTATPPSSGEKQDDKKLTNIPIEQVDIIPENIQQQDNKNLPQTREPSIAAVNHTLENIPQMQMPLIDASLEKPYLSHIVTNNNNYQIEPVNTAEKPHLTGSTEQQDDKNPKQTTQIDETRNAFIRNQTHVDNSQPNRQILVDSSQLNTGLLHTPDMLNKSKDKQNGPTLEDNGVVVDKPNHHFYRPKVKVAFEGNNIQANTAEGKKEQLFQGLANPDIGPLQQKAFHKRPFDKMQQLYDPSTPRNRPMSANTRPRQHTQKEKVRRPSSAQPLKYR